VPGRSTGQDQHRRILTCLGVELPIDCCPACEREGYELFNRKNDDYLVAQMLDQKNKQFDKNTDPGES
jgi:hypothetical protein